MWLFAVLAIVVTLCSIAIGIAWPIALVLGLALPGLGSWLWLAVSGQNAPFGKLNSDSPRTLRFLKTLAERYRHDGRLDLASDLEVIIAALEAGRASEANGRFSALSATVAHDPRSTNLISTWQRSWRDSSR